VCTAHPMITGTHYVEFTLLIGQAFVGVVEEGFDAELPVKARESDESWMLSTVCDASSGCLFRDETHSFWQGQPLRGEIKQGDVVGLLLDLGQRTLSVYLNGARRGVMLAPGMKDQYGKAVASLAGPLRWAVDVSRGGSVRIERRPSPGLVPSAEEVAAAVAWNKANYNLSVSWQQLLQDLTAQGVLVMLM
jgi:hypothetical protein